MESNTNNAWEPEETKISTKPAYEQQTENIDNSLPEEEILPQTEEDEEESFENEKIEEIEDEDEADDELYTEDENADSGYKNSIHRGL